MTDDAPPPERGSHALDVARGLAALLRRLDDACATPPAADGAATADLRTLRWRAARAFLAAATRLVGDEAKRGRP